METAVRSPASARWFFQSRCVPIAPAFRRVRCGSSVCPGSGCRECESKPREIQRPRTRPLASTRSPQALNERPVGIHPLCLDAKTGPLSYLTKLIQLKLVRGFRPDGFPGLESNREISFHDERRLI